VTMDVERAAVIAGDGVVARFPGVVCVARSPDRQAVRRLLDVCAAAAGPDPGRGLARRLARWMGSSDGPGDDLVFGTVSVAGDRLGVFLVGATSVAVPGDPDTLSGTDAATWTDRIIARPEAPVVLALDGAVPPSGLAGSPNDLRAGVVPGAGVVLFASPDAMVDPLDDRAGTEQEWFDDRPDPGAISLPWPDPSPSTGNGATGRGAPAPARIPPRGFSAPEVTNGHPAGNGEAFGGRHAILDPAAHPLDGAAEPGPATPRPAEDRVGADDPLFGPRSAFAPRTVSLEAEPPPPTPVVAAPPVPPPPRIPAAREPAGAAPTSGSPRSLGRLVFDDGATYTVDASFLVGRTPEADPRARSGELRPIVLDDDAGSVSRVHAEILVEGREVVLVDSGSRNGTFLAGPEETSWTPLAPGGTSRLVPGTRVRVGGRTFVFEKPS
jgi:hypothetical protein